MTAPTSAYARRGDSVRRTAGPAAAAVVIGPPPLIFLRSWNIGSRLYHACHVGARDTAREDLPPVHRRARSRDDHAHARRSGPPGDRAPARRRPAARLRRALDCARTPPLDRLLPPAAAARGRRHAHPRRRDAASHLLAPRRPRSPLPRVRRRADALTTAACAAARGPTAVG